MTACTPQLAQRFLADRLSDAEVKSFVSHLDDCRACRVQLERDAGPDEDWRETRDLLAASSEVVTWRGQSDDWLDLPATNAEENGHEKRVDLSFLAPTDDPAYCGRIGNYLVSGLIGRGGMGIVLKAVDSSLNRNVAIKVLDPSLSDLGAARQRFAREARAMAAISHEHVIPIYAVDEHQGLPFFAMEYVAGGTLESRIRRSGTLDAVSIVRIAMQAARALGAAHASGLVHRDIKPGNILLDQGTERVRVADFGLARISNDASFTRSGIVAGTPQFMAPEQVRGETCDARSDLFSLGSVMYAMCTGHPPFRSETVYGAMHRIVHESPRPIREQNIDIPDWLDAFVSRLLEKDPVHRFASADEVSNLLAEELALLQNPGSGIRPKREWLRQPTSASRRRRRRLLAIGGGVLGVVAMVSAAVALWPSQPVPRENLWPPSAQVVPAENIVGEPVAPPARIEPPMPLPPATVPLWNHDQFDQLRGQAEELSRDMTAPAEDVPYDPVPGEIARLREMLRNAGAGE